MERKYRSDSFGEKLKISKDKHTFSRIEAILMENIPGALWVQEGSINDDLSGIDLWVTLYSEERISIDCKIRDEDWSVKIPPRDDLALETWSIVEKKILGWTLDVEKKTDYVLWFWSDTGRWCLVPFLMLNKVFRVNKGKWLKVYQVNRQYTPTQEGGYHSECVFVPREVVWSEIERHFGKHEV